MLPFAGFYVITPEPRLVGGIENDLAARVRQRAGQHLVRLARSSKTEHDTEVVFRAPSSMRLPMRSSSVAVTATMKYAVRAP